MTIDEAAQGLSRTYQQALPTKEQAPSVDLFGIKYAEQIQGMPLKELAARASISQAYGTGLRKGMNLAKYVTMRN